MRGRRGTVAERLQSRVKTVIKSRGVSYQGGLRSGLHRLESPSEDEAHSEAAPAPDSNWLATQIEWHVMALRLLDARCVD